MNNNNCLKPHVQNPMFKKTNQLIDYFLLSLYWMYATTAINITETGINAINGDPDIAKSPATNTNEATMENRTSITKNFTSLFIN